MKNIIQILYFTLAAISLFILSSCFGPPESVPPFPSPITWLNRPANFSLPSFKGKVTLIEFFTEDCSTCIEMQPVLREVLKKQGNNVQILGVYTPIMHQKSTMTKIKKFLKAHKILYPVLYDGDSTILRAFHVTSWPTLIVSNADAKIVYHMQGMENADSIHEAIHEAKKST